MFGFKKHCPVCGMDVDKKRSIKRFGKHLCSESCAQKFLEQKQKEAQKKEEGRRKHPHRGGCC